MCFLLQNNYAKCNNIWCVVIRFIWKLFSTKLILSMVPLFLEITGTPKYYANTIVSIAIGNQSLLKVSN